MHSVPDNRSITEKVVALAHYTALSDHTLDEVVAVCNLYMHLHDAELLKLQLLIDFFFFLILGAGKVI